MFIVDRLFRIKQSKRKMQWVFSYGPKHDTRKPQTASTSALRPLQHLHKHFDSTTTPLDSPVFQSKTNFDNSSWKNFKDSRKQSKEKDKPIQKKKFISEIDRLCVQNGKPGSQKGSKDRSTSSNQQLSCFQLIKMPKPSLFTSLSDLNRLQFPVLSYSMKELMRFSRQLCEDSPQRRVISRTFNLPKLIELIAQNYQNLSYHNFSHAFSVLLLIHQAYNRSPKLRKCLQQKQWFYVFLAALAHDLNHPGTSNAFEIKKKSKYAVQANNVSVLQKMHLSSLWGILKSNSQVNFLQGYSNYQSQEIKQLITRLILATDVAKHFNGLQALSIIHTQEKSLTGENAIVAVQQLFHGCDIGNPCLDFDNYMNWSALVSYQFNQITNQQNQLGLQVTGYLKYENLDKFYSGQIGFCKGLVLPLWKELALVFEGLEEMPNNVIKNMEELQRRKNKQMS